MSFLDSAGSALSGIGSTLGSINDTMYPPISGTNQLGIPPDVYASLQQQDRLKTALTLLALGQPMTQAQRAEATTKLLPTLGQGMDPLKMGLSAAQLQLYQTQAAKARQEMEAYKLAQTEGGAMLGGGAVVSPVSPHTGVAPVISGGYRAPGVATAMPAASAVPVAGPGQAAPAAPAPSQAAPIAPVAPIGGGSFPALNQPQQTLLRPAAAPVVAAPAAAPVVAQPAAPAVAAPAAAPSAEPYGGFAPPRPLTPQEARAYRTDLAINPGTALTRIAERMAPGTAHETTMLTEDQARARGFQGKLPPGQYVKWDLATNKPIDFSQPNPNDPALTSANKQIEMDWKTVGTSQEAAAAMRRTQPVLEHMRDLVNNGAATGPFTSATMGLRSVLQSYNLPVGADVTDQKLIESGIAHLTMEAKPKGDNVSNFERGEFEKSIGSLDDPVEVNKRRLGFEIGNNQYIVKKAEAQRAWMEDHTSLRDFDKDWEQKRKDDPTLNPVPKFSREDAAKDYFKNYYEALPVGSYVKMQDKDGEWHYMVKPKPPAAAQQQQQPAAEQQQQPPPSPTVMPSGTTPAGAYVVPPLPQSF